MDDLAEGPRVKPESNGCFRKACMAGSGRLAPVDQRQNEAPSPQKRSHSCAPLPTPKRVPQVRFAARSVVAARCRRRTESERRLDRPMPIR